LPSGADTESDAGAESGAASALERIVVRHSKDRR
jgi:hypothetical protein